MMLPQRVKQYMMSHHMVQTESHVLIGLSGGADSVCLLYVLQELAEELNVSLEAMHVHHGIRGAEADEDAAFCQQLCQRLEIPLTVVQVDVPALAREQKRSLEEAARMARYEELEKRRCQLGQQAVIAVAHHREDQAETVLWNLLRGSGLKGLAGMEPVQGTVIRPLLEESKEELLAYLQRQEILWQQDSTNDSDDYTRNRIRHHLLAYAQKELNAQAARHICQAAQIAGQADGYLRRQADAWLGRYGVDGVLDVVQLVQEEKILQQYVLRQWLRTVYEPMGDGLTDVTARHMEGLQALLVDIPGTSADRRMDLPKGVVVRRNYHRLWAEWEPEKEISGDGSLEGSHTKDHDDLPESATVDLNILKQRWNEGHSQTIRISWGQEMYAICLHSYEKSQKIPVKQYTKWMNYDKLEEALVIRTRQPGDYFLLPDGGRKTVKSYMIDEKIPASQRDRIPVVAQGSHVLWIPGYRLSEGAKVSEETKIILEITRYGG